MSAHTLRQDYATSLLVDLRASRSTLPRHEALTGWLQDYLKPARAGDREIEPGLANENLLAINAHLEAFDIPATKRPSLN
jgi:hypothetical protein